MPSNLWETSTSSVSVDAKVQRDATQASRHLCPRLVIVGQPHVGKRTLALRLMQALMTEGGALSPLTATATSHGASTPQSITAKLQQRGVGVVFGSCQTASEGGELEVAVVDHPLGLYAALPTKAWLDCTCIMFVVNASKPREVCEDELERWRSAVRTRVLQLHEEGSIAADKEPRKRDVDVNVLSSRFRERRIKESPFATTSGATASADHPAPPGNADDYPALVRRLLFGSLRQRAEPASESAPLQQPPAVPPCALVCPTLSVLVANKCDALETISREAAKRNKGLTLDEASIAASRSRTAAAPPDDVDRLRGPTVAALTLHRLRFFATAQCSDFVQLSATTASQTSYRALGLYCIQQIQCHSLGSEIDAAAAATQHSDAEASHRQLYSRDRDSTEDNSHSSASQKGVVDAVAALLIQAAPSSSNAVAANPNVHTLAPWFLIPYGCDSLDSLVPSARMYTPDASSSRRKEWDSNLAGADERGRSTSGLEGRRNDTEELLSLMCEQHLWDELGTHTDDAES